MGISVTPLYLYILSIYDFINITILSFTLPSSIYMNKHIMIIMRKNIKDDETPKNNRIYKMMLRIKAMFKNTNLDSLII